MIKVRNLPVVSFLVHSFPYSQFARNLIGCALSSGVIARFSPYPEQFIALYRIQTLFNRRISMCWRSSLWLKMLGGFQGTDPGTPLFIPHTPPFSILRRYPPNFFSDSHTLSRTPVPLSFIWSGKLTPVPPKFCFPTLIPPHQANIILDSALGEKVSHCYRSRMKAVGTQRSKNIGSILRPGNLN